MMISIKKIAFPLVAFAWLLGLHSIALNNTSAVTLSVEEASYQLQSPSSKDSSHLFQGSPFLPGLFVETEWHAGPEIEPNSHHALKNSSNSDSLVTGSHYLRVSEWTVSYHPALKLIFPFHTYL